MRRNLPAQLMGSLVANYCRKFDRAALRVGDLGGGVGKVAPFMEAW